MTSLRLTRDERGFSMFLVIMTMFVTSMFVVAGFAAANGDLPVSGDSRDRKVSYTAGEAGMNFYLNHLNHDSDYWTKCDNVPAPNASEPNPVNQQWSGTGPDPRRWRSLPAPSTAQYTVELLPAPGYAKCVEGDQKSFVDLKTGTFRLRFTGRPTPTSTQRRSIVATFRREGFLDFLYFTNYEDLDPQALSSSSARSAAQTNCADRYRSQRTSTSCVEIQFVTGDRQNGPLHSNDTLLICGSPIFGRDANDKVEVAQPKPGTVPGKNCSNSAVMKGVFKENAKNMEMPATNSTLEDTAKANGVEFTGKTYIRLNANDTMTVTTFPRPNFTAQTTTMAMPTNGVIYIANDDLSGCTGEYPTAATYNESAGCGDVYVSGQYSRSLTIGAENDIIVAPTVNGVLTGSNDANLTRTNDSTLGLIANNFVRVGHRVDRTTGTNVNTSQYPLVSNVKIDAAILSLRHSFIVDNYDVGSCLGDLTVTGAIAQKYRGAVGTSGCATGYFKNYNYDDRLRYRSPPFFLDPVDAAWSVIRSNEQVPAH